jgi:tryptophan synthase alpha chain
MGYYNPIIAYGRSRFLQDAKSSGVDGFIIPDLPVDEADRLCCEAVELGLSPVFLVSPTSTRARIKLIDNRSSDFVYAVTVTGVTGAPTAFGRETDDYLQSLRNQLTKPFVAGFGVASPESARRLCRYADGVVIGSALVRTIREAGGRRQSTTEVAKFLKRMRKAL